MHCASGSVLLFWRSRTSFPENSIRKNSNGSTGCCCWQNIMALGSGSHFSISKAYQIHRITGGQITAYCHLPIAALLKIYTNILAPKRGEPLTWQGQGRWPESIKTMRKYSAGNCGMKWNPLEETIGSALRPLCLILLRPYFPGTWSYKRWVACIPHCRKISTGSYLP